jgi:hypothetical protein
LTVPAAPVWGEVTVERVAYFNQPNCYRLSNGTVEVIVTTDIGPRIIRYAFVGQEEENILAELPDLKVETELGEWRPYGGHRLWHAPEAKPRTYAPDNGPVKFEIVGKDTIHLTQDVEPKAGIQKELIITLAGEGTEVTIVHRLTNRNLWSADLAPWGLTIMNGGGMAILPQEPYISHDDYLLPARPLVLWHYTDLGDPRWKIGKKYITLRTDANLNEPQKAGIANKQEWAAYLRNRVLFIKRFPYKKDANYPDYGCNCETYTAGTFMEVETLGPMHHLEPGDTAEHVERWYLFKNVNAGMTEATLDAAISPLVEQTKK